VGARRREPRARILVAEADAAARARIRRVLEDDGRFEICAEAAAAGAAIAAATRERPDLCLLGIGLPGGGVGAARELGERLPETKVVMLTDAAGEAEFFEVLRAGAIGYLTKDMDPARLPHALGDALAGRAPIPRALVASLVAEFRDEGPRRREVLVETGAVLTGREWQVLDLLRRGLSTSAIAARLFVSQATVRSHVASLLHKLDVPDRAAIVRLFGSR
jgi:DNA-binding NarL/FixJ family response regulator